VNFPAFFENIFSTTGNDSFPLILTTKMLVSPTGVAGANIVDVSFTIYFEPERYFF
jgi:hypothetical protein